MGKTEKSTPPQPDISLPLSIQEAQVLALYIERGQQEIDEIFEGNIPEIESIKDEDDKHLASIYPVGIGLQFKILELIQIAEHNEDLGENTF